RRFAGLHFVQPVGLAEGIDLVDFATEADEDVAGDVRMPGDAGEDALQHGLRFAGIHRAAALVGESDDAIDIRKIPREVRRAEAVADVMGDAGRAVDAGNDGDVVARARRAAGP